MNTVLTLDRLKDYASRRELSLRDLEAYSSYSAQYIGLVFNGKEPLTKKNHDEIVGAINRAHFAKFHGTFERAPLDKNGNSTKRGKGKKAAQ